MPSFDCFLSHNGQDKPTVRALKDALTARGVRCWLDEERLRPGLSFQRLLEEGIADAASVAVCVAGDAVGPWEDEQMQAALRLAVQDGRAVIPVLLPGARAEPELPLFLGNRTWVDLRGGLDADGIGRLVWGITGRAPSDPLPRSSGGAPAVAAPNPLPPPSTPAPETRRMRTATILFLAASPAGEPKLALDREAREIREKIRVSEHRDALQFRTEWAVRPDDLLQYLNEHRPQAVHFGGHGNAGEILLNDERGSPKPVSGTALRALFRLHRKTLRLVVLNTCYSKDQAGAIVDEIDCAVGMNRAIGDAAAIVFAAAFYRKLGFGASVREAFDEGLVALMLQDIPEERTPELLVKQGVDASRVLLVGPDANPKYTNAFGGLV